MAKSLSICGIELNTGRSKLTDKVRISAETLSVYQTEDDFDRRRVTSPDSFRVKSNEITWRSWYNSPLSTRKAFIYICKSPLGNLLYS